MVVVVVVAVGIVLEVVVVVVPLVTLAESSMTALMVEEGGRGSLVTDLGTKPTVIRVLDPILSVAGSPVVRVPAVDTGLGQTSYLMTPAWPASWVPVAHFWPFL